MPSSTETKWKKFFLSRWFLLTGVCLLLLIGFAFVRAYYRDYQVRKEIERLQQEVSRLEAKRLETIDLLKYAQSPAFVEEKARTELNLTKPGEKVTIIGEGKISTNTAGQPKVKVLESMQLSNPTKWWRQFFK